MTININAKRDHSIDKAQYYILAEAHCSMPGCTSTCTVKLETIPSDDGLTLAVKEAPLHWIASMRHVRCPSCVLPRTTMSTRSLAFEAGAVLDSNDHRAKVAYLVKLREQIAYLKSIRAKKIEAQTTQPDIDARETPTIPPPNRCHL